MAVVATNPESISGPWSEGFVLDKHMLWSVPVGHDGVRTIFDNTRTPLGELLYRFKNRGGPPTDIIETAVAFVRERWPTGINCVVWPPPSVGRTRQPAAILARGIADHLGFTVEPDAIQKIAVTTQVKNLPTYERAAIVEQAIQPGTASMTALDVLIVDDLWQTGSTMRRVAEVLRAMGVGNIRALAMTRTK